MDINSIKKEAVDLIQRTKDLKELDEVWREYSGKKGKISRAFKYLKGLSADERKKTGEEINRAKNEIDNLANERRKILAETEYKKRAVESHFDVTLPGKKIKIGHLHPLTQILIKSEDIFAKMGFRVVEGPEIETEWYNFDALNIPDEHPARDAWNTLWLKATGDSQQSTGNKSPACPVGNRRFSLEVASRQLLLRTHTSPVQVRFMEKNNPPFRLIAPGKVFRYEATDASHEIQFHQLEGLMVGKDVSLANLKGVLEIFVKEFFGKDTGCRWRPSFFPFVEPGLELDIECNICKGKRCPACKNSGWVEVLGAGMVHPNVFKAAGYNPRDWQGFAFGMGVDRLTMMKYRINDIRLFYNGDLRFLEQF